jgi:hypothetical protein
LRIKIIRIMKKILFGALLITVIGSCSKERTCECTSTSVGTRNEKTTAGSTVISDDTENINESSVTKNTEKATKSGFIKYGECFSTESDLSGNNYSYSGGGITTTVSYTGTSSRTCKLK